MYDRADWEALKKAKQKGKPEPIQTVTQILRAAPPMEILTNSEEWDKFLSYLQPLVERSEQESAYLKDKLTDPTIIKHEELVFLKLAYTRQTERTEVLKLVMSLPKEIIKLGELSKKTLKNLDLIEE